MPAIDLTGQKFGKLTTMHIAEHCGDHKPIKWLCICDCGNEKIVNSQNLRQGIIKDCGCGVRNRLVGKRFGRLLVIGPAIKLPGNSGRISWECKCDCGNIVYVNTSNLTAKKSFTASCGCMKRERSTKHGLCKTKIYKNLVAIKGRCKNKKDKNYFRYGGRGITLCDEWDGEHGFENFYKWSMENGYEDSLTIDRIDNNKGYSPDNCRWVTQKVQMNNTRRNRYITIDGETHSLSEWSDIKNISQQTIIYRLNHGWSEYDSITKPIRRKGKAN